MTKNSNYTWKLGMFVILGLALFMIIIYFIGNNKNLFTSTFELKSQFKNVSGLKEGNNVRFSGINVGTVKEIEFLSDSAVMVKIIVKEEVQQYIKTDAIASIGSDGLMGDKVLTISPGSSSNKMVKDKGTIRSMTTVDMEDLMKGLNKSVENAQIITEQLSEFSTKINKGKGALNKVLTDEEFADGLDKTMQNLKTSSDEFVAFTTKMNDKNGTLSRLMTNPNYANSVEKTLDNLEKTSNEFEVFSKRLNNDKGILSKLVGNERLATSLDSSLINIEKASKNIIEIEEAAKNNFLLRGYFKKKEKALEKKNAAMSGN
ncbi:MlaD family protein [Flavobacterium terrigena]|uniref:Phospholipid/cholesterol/gamma-HCH transport system substrate-binding protein n=1 Tax=Flavobacterium terrigena TaxID=402734 RepID=A0A1H6QL89_9FLAO|nr:MlaD family protein [Flavobacterium terrigena]SEI39762.1 phospholipid/cholesterol/gamma-HCH transport system substrate-binding protein [Flavobacterium terrigena]